MQRAEVKQCGEDVNERLESQGTAFAFAQRARGDEQLRAAAQGDTEQQERHTRRCKAGQDVPTALPNNRVFRAR